MRWVIGDIHGMHRMLQALLDAVRQRDREARFYFVGDYVNRGPESKQVVDLLLTLENARFVRGNHDEIFDLVINGQCFEPHPDLFAPVQAFVTFLQFGLDTTLMSYDIDWAMIEQVGIKPNPQAMQKLLEPIPDSHRAFFRSLPVSIKENDLFIVHAKWDVDTPNTSEELAKVLRQPAGRHQVVWARYQENEVRRNKPWTRPGFFGHTPVATYPARKRDPHEPLAGPKIVLLDTGAALTMQGRLTAVCADDRSFIQIDRSLQESDGVLPG